jgi:HK97 family phage portal protein
MNLLRFLPRLSWRDDPAKERRLSLTSAAGWASLFGRESKAGKIVTTETALQLSAVWACVRIIAQTVAGMPLGLYEKRPDGSRIDVEDEDLLRVLSLSPNADQTATEFWETIVGWLCVQGNGYARKVMNGPRLAALVPIPSSHCMPVRRPDGTLVYRVTDGGSTEDIPREQMFHVKGFGLGGDTGLSTIRYGVQSFGAAEAAAEIAAKVFANGLHSSGLLQSDAILKEEQRKQLRDIMAAYVGSQNAGKMMILEAGLKYQPLTLNPEDAQLLETRRFDVEEICRWFGVPPIMIGHAGQGQTMWGTGVEQILIAWLVLGLNPYLTRIEKRIRMQLLPADNRRRIYAEFNREGLLQADSAAKASFLSSMAQNGFMSRNEGRAKLNLPKSSDPGADALTAQSNLAPLGLLGQIAAPAPPN